MKRTLPMRHLALIALVVAFPPSPQVAGQAPSVEDVLARLAAYVTDFIPRFANVVAVETYEQRATEGAISAVSAAASGNTGVVTGSRLPMTWRLKSDILLVRYTLAELDWMMFRDVAEVEGKPVRHEQDRLLRLFASPTADSAQRAARISIESARFHVPGGSVAVTNPLLVLALMQPHYLPRLRFAVGDEERSLGPGVRVIQFDEREAGDDRQSGDALPPLLGDTGRVRGKVWVEVSTGRILKTEARIGPPRNVTTTITTFAFDERLGLTVPAEMRTTWRYDRWPVNGVATYGEFRRFEVQTESVIEAPVR
jgi:hypothetical protein